jgi:hypothetical protein
MLFAVHEQIALLVGRHGHDGSLYSSASALAGLSSPGQSCFLPNGLPVGLFGQLDADRAEFLQILLLEAQSMWSFMR